MIPSAHFLSHPTRALMIPSAKSLHHHSWAHSTSRAHFHGQSIQALTISSAYLLGHHTWALTILLAHFLGHHTQAPTIPLAKSLYHHTWVHSTSRANFHGSSTQALMIPLAHFCGHHWLTRAHMMHSGPQPHAGMSARPYFLVHFLIRAQPYILVYYIIQAHLKSLRVIRFHRAKIMQAGREHRYKVTTWAPMLYHMCGPTDKQGVDAQYTSRPTGSV